MPRKTMIEAIRDAMDVMMERDDNVVVFGEDVGFFGGVFRGTQGLQAKYGKTPLLRCADQRAWHRRRGCRHGGIRPAALRRDPVRRLHVSGLRPDRLRGRTAALPLERAVHLPARRAHADRRRHLRRTDAQPKSRGAVHPCVRPQDGGALQSGRCQRIADRGDRGPRSGDLPGAEAAVQRTVRRPPRQARDALVQPRAWRGRRRPLCRCRLGKAPSGAKARR